MTFTIATTLSCALPREEVRRILPIPTLGHPPGCPSLVEGVLNLAEVAVPVIRVDRLFGFPASPWQPYLHLILLRDPVLPLALLVDRVTGVLTVPTDAVSPLAEGETINGCVVGQIGVNDSSIQILSRHRLLEERERQALADFQTMQQERLEGLGIS